MRLRIIIFLIITVTPLLTHAANHQRYFRHIAVDGKHSYNFRNEILGMDTSRARCYRCSYDDLGRVIKWEYISAKNPEVDPFFGMYSQVIVFGPNFERHTYFDKKEKPFQNSGEYAEQATLSVDKKTMTNFQYDKIGRLLEFDWNGCSRYLWELNSKGYMIKQFNLDV